MTKLLNQKNFLRNALITVYILIVLGISATARADFSLYPIVNGHHQVQTKTFVGQVAMTPERVFFLIVADDEAYELRSNVDLFDYNGQTVQIEGYEIKQKVGPVLQTASLDPLPESGELFGAPLLVVFGISEVAN